MNENNFPLCTSVVRRSRFIARRRIRALVCSFALLLCFCIGCVAEAGTKTYDALPAPYYANGLGNGLTYTENCFYCFYNNSSCLWFDSEGYYTDCDIQPMEFSVGSMDWMQYSISFSNRSSHQIFYVDKIGLIDSISVRKWDVSGVNYISINGSSFSYNPTLYALPIAAEDNIVRKSGHINSVPVFSRTVETGNAFIRSLSISEIYDACRVVSGNLRCVLTFYFNSDVAEAFAAEASFVFPSFSVGPLLSAMSAIWASDFFRSVLYGLGCIACFGIIGKAVSTL